MGGRGSTGKKKVKALKSEKKTGKLKLNLRFFGRKPAKDLQKQNDKSLIRGIKSHSKNILEHKNKIKNPNKHHPDWNKLSDIEKAGTLKHWSKEIENFKTSINQATEILKERRNKK